jgi:hypothetical protein
MKRAGHFFTVMIRPVLEPAKPANSTETGGIPHGDKPAGV